MLEKEFEVIHFPEDKDRLGEFISVGELHGQPLDVRFDLLVRIFEQIDDSYGEVKKFVVEALKHFLKDMEFVLALVNGEELTERQTPKQILEGMYKFTGKNKNNFKTFLNNAIEDYLDFREK